jgi:hypothetical protein
MSASDGDDGDKVAMTWPQHGDDTTLTGDDPTPTRPGDDVATTRPRPGDGATPTW